MIAHLSKNDTNMFYNYIDKANIFFEYGSGGSTYQASIRPNIKKIYSVESDKLWYDKVKKNIKHNNFTYYYNEMDTVPNTWGNPGKNSTSVQQINYSSKILTLKPDEQKNIDLILIDGRFRVACCLKAFNVISTNCLIMFDDFLNRNQYHIVLDYYDIIDKTVDNRMVVLKKKNNIVIPNKLIKKYELIKN
jgi:hypothetical protein